ncbi:MAG: hypothetical protein IJD89_00500 [Clostridia bacterium]|nr:hypothetical protein [Clostridia bacterium]
MTINGTMSMRNPMNVQKIRKNCKPVYCIENGKRWESATDCANELGLNLFTLYDNLNGRTKACKKMHFSYEEDVSKTQSKLADRVSELESKQSELERKAALWDAYQTEQEAIRKANEAREMAIAKADAKIARRENIVARIKAELEAAEARLAQAQQERAELN